MVKVQINSHHIEELQYLVNYVLKRIKCENVQISTGDSSQKNIVFSQGQKKIIFNSSFFSTENLDYHSPPLPPSPIEIPQYDIVSFYGQNHFKQTSDSLIFDFDLFGTIFFCLTRWEEFTFAKHKSDSHGRFIGKESYLAQSQLINRPVVDELVSFLQTLFVEYGFIKNQIQEKEGTKLFFSHDVDFILQAPQWTDRLKKLLKGESLNPINIFKVGGKYRERDLYNNFDFLMQISETANLKSTFFLMLGGDHELDFKYELNDDFKWMIDKIKKRNHHLGIHPSYQSSENFEILKQEIETFQTLFPDEKLVSRQHYLRFKIPETINWLEDLGVKEEHSFGYSDISGFRCGTAAPFQYFDFLQRKTLDITIFPLVGMDVTLLNAEELSDEQILEKILNWKNKLPKMSDISLSILFHNHIVHKSKDLYRKIGNLA